MVDDSKLLEHLIKSQIQFPDFYHPFSQLNKVELLMGQFVLTKLHYSKNDQFICVIEGSVEMRLVPHVNRHEVYGDKSFESPVNLFKADEEYKLHPNV